VRKLAIALFVLMGCTGNKPGGEQKYIPTCEEFYKFYRDKMERLSKLWELPEAEIDTMLYVQLEILENSIKKYNCKETITCEERTYCVSPMLYHLR